MTFLAAIASRIDGWGLHSAPSVALAIGIPVLGGFAGAISMGNSVKTWYKDIKKAPWNPPPYVFGPTWTVLYTCMGYASHRVFYLVPAHLRATPLALYGAQLALNFAWTPVFFGAKRFGLAMANIALMWGGIAATAYSFFEYDATAGYLMLPYLAWVSYASTLNWYIWRNNPRFRHKLAAGAAGKRGKKE
ncbi:hypothetical protein H9P43_000147 [Blastocladiella emersonii ATCC 22665]|nr:hypothetical protein H9P43_000147 [Blastocladiella emersonii ATCC 22665]